MTRLLFKAFDVFAMLLGAVVTVLIVWPFAAGRWARVKGSNPSHTDVSPC